MYFGCRRTLPGEQFRCAMPQSHPSKDPFASEIDVNETFLDGWNWLHSRFLLVLAMSLASVCRCVLISKAYGTRDFMIGAWFHSALERLPVLGQSTWSVALAPVRRFLEISTFARWMRENGIALEMGQNPDDMLGRRATHDGDGLRRRC